MPDIVLTEDELVVISRCSGTAAKLYLRVRARMDFRTGVAGVVSGLSYQALREWTEEAVEKGSGEMLIQPSLQNIRAAINQLIRRGLLRRLKTERLVFFCPLARTEQSRPNRTQHEPNRAKRPEPNTEPNTNPTGPEALYGAGCDESEPAEPNTEPNTNPTGQNAPNPTYIRDRLTPSTSQSSSTEIDGVDPGERLSADIVGLAEKMKAPGDPVGPSQQLFGLVALLNKRGARINAMHPLVLAWEAAGVDHGVITEAMDVCIERRNGSGQPVNAGYLDAVVRDLLDRRARGPSVAWWTTEAATVAKGRELGLEARPGEEMAAFRARIKAAITKAQGVQA